MKRDNEQRFINALLELVEQGDIDKFEAIRMYRAEFDASLGECVRLGLVAAVDNAVKRYRINADAKELSNVALTIPTFLRQAND